MRIGVLELEQADESSSCSQRAMRCCCRIADNFERKLYVVERGAPGQQRRLLEHEAELIDAAGRGSGLAAHFDAAGGRRQEIADEAQQRALAASGRPEQRDEFALGHAQADVGERLHCAAFALKAQAHAVEHDAGATCRIRGAAVCGGQA